MEEIIFPPSPCWFLPNILASREDGSVCYGAKKNIVILKSLPNDSFEALIIYSAHNSKIISVAFSPSNCSENIANTLASCSEDGFVKLWNLESLTAFIGHKSHWDHKEASKIVCLDWSLANPHHIVSVAENDTIVLWNVLSNTTTKFIFQSLRATTISCCPFNEKIVAVGKKSGLIYIINLTGSGEIIYKLRGHDNIIHSLAWCPVPFNIFKDELREEFLLASACQNKEIFVWQAGTDGKCQVKFQIPTSSMSKKPQNYKSGNSFNYSALCWSDPYKLYFCSNFGELIYFDIKSYLVKPTKEGQKLNKISNFLKLAHCFHTKGLFAIAGAPSKSEVIIYNNNDIFRNLKFENQSNCSFIKKNTEDDKKWDIVSPNISLPIWTAGQDRKVVACRMNDNHIELIKSFNTMNGSVYCAVISPLDPNKLAVGVGDGVIRLWNLTELNGEIQIYRQKIQDRVMALAWHPVKEGILAYGTSGGRVGVIDTNSNKMPSVFPPKHPAPIYNLSWGPPFSSSQDGILKKDHFCLYAVENNSILVYNPSEMNADVINLGNTIQFPCKRQTDIAWKPDYTLLAIGNEDGNICLIDYIKFSLVHTILAYKKLIQSIVWHPLSTSVDSGLSPYHGYFTSGSTDNSYEIKVFNYIKKEGNVLVEQVATLKGHYGHIQSVSWSPHIGGCLVSSSADGSVQIWDVISQTPLVNFTPINMPMFSIWSPNCSDIIITGCKDDAMCVTRISKQTRTLPVAPKKIKKEAKDKLMSLSAAKEVILENGIKQNGKTDEMTDVIVAEAKRSSKSLKEIKIFSKPWKGDANEELKNCYSLLKHESSDSPLNYSLPLLCDEEYYKEMIKNEEESCRKSNNWNEFYELSLWKGNIKEVLEEKIQTGQLNDFAVSLAPTISPRMWQEACLSYSKTLAEKNMFRKAASYLIVCHRIYEAIKLLTDANLFIEALCIARSRLPKSDPIVNDTVQQYAAWLFKNGSFLKACECYIYLGDYLEVAKVCGKKSSPEYLALAALAAKKCSSTDLETLEATNAILKCFEMNNLDLAQRICDDHENLKHLRLMHNMYTTIQRLDAEELELNKDILSHIKGSIQVEDVVFPVTTQQLYNKCGFYKNKQKVLIILTQELSFACCSKDSGTTLKHLIRALSACYRYIQPSENKIHLLFKLCTWLAPNNFLNENSFFAATNNQLSFMKKSLRAFLCTGIAKHINDHSMDTQKYLHTLNEIIDDLIDEDSYKYFKNLLEAEVCEKRLLTNHNKLARIELSKKVGLSNGDVSKNTVTNGMENGTTNIIETLDALTLENGTENSSENLKQEINGGHEFLNQLENEELKKAIQEDTELLSRLKSEIERFEEIRVSSPNPVPVCFMIKNALEKVQEMEDAKILLENLEEKSNLIKLF